MDLRTYKKNYIERAVTKYFSKSLLSDELIEKYTEIAIDEITNEWIDKEVLYTFETAFDFEKDNLCYEYLKLAKREQEILEERVDG